MPAVLTKPASAIATSKRRKVRCYNKPVTLASTDVDKNFLVELKVELAEMML